MYKRLVQKYNLHTVTVQNEERSLHLTLLWQTITQNLECGLQLCRYVYRILWFITALKNITRNNLTHLKVPLSVVKRLTIKNVVKNVAWIYSVQTTEMMVTDSEIKLHLQNQTYFNPHHIFKVFAYKCGFHSEKWKRGEMITQKSFVALGKVMPRKCARCLREIELQSLLHRRELRAKWMCAKREENHQLLLPMSQYLKFIKHGRNKWRDVNVWQTLVLSDE